MFWLSKYWNWIVFRKTIVCFSDGQRFVNQCKLDSRGEEVRRFVYMSTRKELVEASGINTFKLIIQFMKKTYFNVKLCCFP